MLKTITYSHIKDLNSEALKELQKLLNKWGYNLAVDGIFGPKTLNAFTSFKRENKLSEPEIFGQTTLQHLLKNPRNRQVNQDGLNLIKEFEGFRSTAYLCPAKVWTIGYGSTFYPDGRRVKQGDKITPNEAEILLRDTVQSFADQVSNLINVPITDNQFSALVSLTFNIGIGAFSKSTLLRVLNQRNYTEASNQFLRWNRAGGRILEGLTRRRNRERQLFLK